MWPGVVAAVVLVIALLSGCGSQQASATGDGSNLVDNSKAVATAAAPATNSKVATSQTGPSEANAAPRPKLKPGARTKVLAKAGDRSYDKTFDDLRFEMTVGEKFVRSLLTNEIEALNGQKIRIRGYILPTPQKHGIQQFVLVRDNQECCFGPGAALYDCILVKMQPGKTADFTIRPIAVEGTFTVKEFELGGKQLAIYEMAAESAQ